MHGSPKSMPSIGSLVLKLFMKYSDGQDGLCLPCIHDMSSE